MPSPLIAGGGSTSGGTAQGTHPTNAQQSQAVIAKSFVRASMEHRESAGIDRTVTISASDQDLGSFPIPAYGYLRSLMLLVTVSGGAGTAVYQADAPWSILKNIVVSEPNGATIAQFNSGYDLYVVNKYGGFRAYNDPKGMPDYSLLTAGGNFTFAVRIPLELRGRDGLGSLPNQNAAAAFQLRVTVAGTATVYSTAPPTTLPNVRLQVFSEEWDQPSISSDGTSNMTTPPAMNTTQFHTKQVYPIVAGQNTVRLTRVGNYIRNLYFIYRDTGNARITNASGNFPPLTQLFYDTRPVDTVQSNIWRKTLFERYGYGQATVETYNGLDNGVYPYDFAHEFDGAVGYELNDLWLPTLSSTRLEFQGSFGVAGTLEVITNDVAVAGNVFIQ